MCILTIPADYPFLYKGVPPVRVRAIVRALTQKRHAVTALVFYFKNKRIFR